MLGQFFISPKWIPLAWLQSNKRMLNLDSLSVCTIKHEQTQQQQKIRDQNWYQSNKSAGKLLYLAYRRNKCPLKTVLLALIGYCAFPQQVAAPQPRVLRTVSYSMSLWWVFSNAFHHLNHCFLHLLIKSMSPSFSLPLSVCLLFFRSHSFPSLSLSLSCSQSLSPALWPVLLPCRSWLMMRKISQGQAPC